MIIVIAQATIQPGQREEFLGALTDLVEASRSEAGCLTYDIVESLETPNHFIMLERWDQRSSLDAHLGTPHVQAFLGVVGTCVAAPPSQEVFNISSVERLM